MKDASPLTSLDITRCALGAECRSQMDTIAGQHTYYCDAKDCGRPLLTPFLNKAAASFATWRDGRLARGEALTQSIMIEKIQNRWKSLSVAHAKQIIEAADAAARRRPNDDG